MNTISSEVSPVCLNIVNLEMDGPGLRAPTRLQSRFSAETVLPKESVREREEGWLLVNTNTLSATAGIINRFLPLIFLNVVAVVWTMCSSYPKTSFEADLQAETRHMFRLSNVAVSHRQLHRASKRERLIPGMSQRWWQVWAWFPVR